MHMHQSEAALHCNHIIRVLCHSYDEWYYDHILLNECCAYGVATYYVINNIMGGCRAWCRKLSLFRSTRFHTWICQVFVIFGLLLTSLLYLNTDLVSVFYWLYHWICIIWKLTEYLIGASILSYLGQYLLNIVQWCANYADIYKPIIQLSYNILIYFIFMKYIYILMIIKFNAMVGSTTP